MRVIAGHGRDFNSLADHIAKLRNFTKCNIHEFSAFPLHTAVAQTSYRVAMDTRYVYFLQNLFEMRLPKIEMRKDIFKSSR